MKYYLFLVLAPFLWATDAILGGDIHSYGPAIDLGFLRWLIAFCVLFPFAYPSLKKQWPIVKSHWVHLMIAGGLAVAASPICAYQALHFTSPLNTGVVEGTTPAFILLLTVFYYRKAPPAMAILGIVCAFIGILFVVLQGDFFRLSSVQWTIGDLWIFLSVMAWALYTFLLSVSLIPLSLPVFLCAIIFFGLLFLLPLFLWGMFHDMFLILNKLTISSLIYIGIGPSLLGYFFWTYGVGKIGAEKAGLFMNLYPVFTTLLSVFFLSQHLYYYDFVGLVLVCSGICLLLKSPSIP